MQTWTSQDLDDFCEQAIELLNKKKQLQLELKNCWLYSNSSGSNFHIVYHNNFLDKDFHLCRNGNILSDKDIGVDVIAGLKKITDIKMKIILRIAFFIHHDCKINMRNK